VGEVGALELSIRVVAPGGRLSWVRLKLQIIPLRFSKKVLFASKDFGYRRVKSFKSVNRQAEFGVVD
jgi:hypothetical protein